VQAVSDAQRLGRPFDLVLMDMQMPELDGYAATAKLRSMGFARPVIALTANAMKTDRDKCLAVGCTAYLSKPVDRRLLLQSVQRHMARAAAPGNANPSMDLAEPAASATPATPASAVTTLLPLDPASSSTTVPVAPPSADASPMDDGMDQLRRDFIANLPAYITDLTAALASHNSAAAQRVLHQLSGVGGVFGFQWITDEATILDGRLRVGETLETLQLPIEELMKRIRQIAGYQSERET